jgi:hypothetical protein
MYMHELSRQPLTGQRNLHTCTHMYTHTRCVNVREFEHSRTRALANSCMHTAVCTQLYAHSCIHTVVYTQLYAHSCMHTVVCTQLYAHSCMHTDVYTQLYAHSCMNLVSDVPNSLLRGYNLVHCDESLTLHRTALSNTHTHTYRHKRTHTHTYTYTHMHSHTQTHALILTTIYIDLEAHKYPTGTCTHQCFFKDLGKP